jgi:hypothetical protein
MSDFKVGAKKAVVAIEHLLYNISESELTNVAAFLAQENAVPVDTYCKRGGYWTFAVVERFLLQRGMKCTCAGIGGKWLLDAPRFLRENQSVVGFLDTLTLTSFKWDGTQWTTPTANCTILPKQSLVVIHKMWIPFEQFYDKTFHVTTDESDWTRFECHPSSCWRVETVNYEGCKNAVKQKMREYKKSPIMMSNSKEILMCKPTSKGWKTETLLNYECLSLQDSAKQVSESLSALLVDHIECTGGDRGWTVMAHALFSAFQHLKGRLNPNDLSNFTQAEVETLRDYETMYLDKMKRYKDV